MWTSQCPILPAIGAYILCLEQWLCCHTVIWANTQLTMTNRQFGLLVDVSLLSWKLPLAAHAFGFGCHLKSSRVHIQVFSHICVIKVVRVSYIVCLHATIWFHVSVFTIRAIYLVSVYNTRTIYLVSENTTRTIYHVSVFTTRAIYLVSVYTTRAIYLVSVYNTRTIYLPCEWEYYKNHLLGECVHYQSHLPYTCVHY